MTVLFGPRVLGRGTFSAEDTFLNNANYEPQDKRSAYLSDSLLYFYSKGPAEFEHILSHVRWTTCALKSFEHEVRCSDRVCSWVICKNDCGTMQVIPQTPGAMSCCQW